MALRMSGEGANLGLKLLQGNIGTYSIERDLNQRSDDRGDFILHPVIGCIEPGEEAVVQWELFWFDTRERFYSELLEVPHFPVVFLERSTYFTGETMCFKAAVKMCIRDRYGILYSLFLRFIRKDFPCENSCC